jgi:hypothetical protein
MTWSYHGQNDCYSMHQHPSTLRTALRQALIGHLIAFPRHPGPDQPLARRPSDQCQRSPGRRAMRPDNGRATKGAMSLLQSSTSACQPASQGGLGVANAIRVSTDASTYPNIPLCARHAVACRGSAPANQTRAASRHLVQQVS